MHIQNSCALINVFLCCNRTCRKLADESPLELFHMILQITIHCCDLHQLGGINLTQALNVNRASIFVNSMMPLWIVLQNFINFLEIKVLNKETKSNKLNYMEEFKADNFMLFSLCSTTTSMIVSAPNSFLHWSISDHICFDFSMSNFLALKNLHEFTVSLNPL